MTTLFIIRKPGGFRLPSTYQRKSLETSSEESGENYTFMKPIKNEEGIPEFLMGEFYHREEIKYYPGKRDLEQKHVESPTTSFCSVYMPSGKNLIYCIGNNPETIRRVLSVHSGFNMEDLRVNPINLDSVERGFKKGLFIYQAIATQTRGAQKR